MQGTWIHSLVWEVRPHMLNGKKKKKKDNLDVYATKSQWEGYVIKAFTLHFFHFVSLKVKSKINEHKWLYPWLNNSSGLGKNIHKWRQISSEVIWKKWEYLIWLYLLFRDSAFFLFMHLLNKYLLSTSTLH